MNYIGSKRKLGDFILDTVQKTAGHDLSQMVFCDLFAGTGIVGRLFKPLVKQVISNDLEYYSYVLNRHYIGNNTPLSANDWLESLNALKGVEGFIFNEYSENGKSNRLFFSQENGMKIDAIRQKIEQLKTTQKINDDMYYYLLASLLESADKIANTAVVYGAYLKKIKKAAQKPIKIEPAEYTCHNQNNQVFNYDSNLLIKKIKGDLLYLDPPYNSREYGANYHLLNTIAKYDQFTPIGKTGLRNYNRSSYCKKNEVASTFEDLIKNANFKYNYLSYNNEGLMTPIDIKNIMSKYGKYKIYKKDYKRFKADSDVNRAHKQHATIEYIHVLTK